MVPMHAEKNRKGALHEPSEAPPGFGLRQSSGALAMEASQPKAPEDWRSPRRYRAIRRFVVPIHAKKRKRSLYESARPPKRSLPRESGAEDARTPNAGAWSADSAASAKRLECVRFIGAFRPARDRQRFMGTTHTQKANRSFL